VHDKYQPPHIEAKQFVIVEACSLDYRYPDGQTALEKIDLTIFEGDRVALIGHNGAGKTTLVKLLSGLYSPLAGEVLYKNKVLQGENLRQARLEVGILFQDPDDQLFCNTLSEDVAFGPINQSLSPKEVERQVREAVRKVGLEGLLYKAAHNLSYGQKKRAALATVLAMQPEILILDEPTAYLDPKQEKLFTELIQDFPGTLIAISHDLPFLYSICDRAVVMEKGRIHHDYTMKDLVSQGAYLRAHGLDFTFRYSCCRGNGEEGHTHDHRHAPPHPHPHSKSSLHTPPAPARRRLSNPGLLSDDGSRRASPPYPVGESKPNCDAESPLIHFLDYSYRYSDGTWGIRNTHLHVYEGESVAVVGENGAGKSTLARCLLGIAEGRGEYEFDGRPVTERNRRDIWKQVGMVFQDPADQLFCPSCWEEVAFGPKQLGLSKGEIKARVEEALEAVGLEGYEHRVPHHLSSGERKRLAIAAAISIKSRVLILDEPTANLDAASEEILLQILSRLKVTKILISHDMPLILSLCERVLVLHQGELIRDYNVRDFQQDKHLISINGLDYTLKNACCREIIALQESAQTNK
jgi:energy-coupling factor transporter ATP-binding protein EcfA2